MNCNATNATDCVFIELEVSLEEALEILKQVKAESNPTGTGAIMGRSRWEDQCLHLG